MPPRYHGSGPAGGEGTTPNPGTNLVSDAQVVVILRQHDVRTFYTNDADFRRLEGLEIRNPLES
jgi:predicted nucleic acid-binding protein